MKILLTHAYSRGNSGDGLLVDLSRRLVTEAHPGATVEVVATDPGSFDDDAVRAWPDGGRTAPGRRRLVLAGALGPGDWFRGRLREADLVVAVGGGYLRGAHTSQLLKSSLVHVRQLQETALAGTPFVYLPQSIGPFPRTVARRVEDHLSRASAVHVRDDVSAVELRRLPNVVRAPDLAVLALGQQVPPVRPREASDELVLAARALPGGPRYTALVRELVVRYPRARWAFQSSVGGNDDREFLRQVGVPRPLPLRQVLAETPGATVVSVRLHGALEAVLAGHPAVHLSYERKGFGAFQDLGLAGYVLNARTSSPDDVGAAVERVRSDPATYWAAVDRARDRLEGARSALVARLASLTPLG